MVGNFPPNLDGSTQNWCCCCCSEAQALSRSYHGSPGLYNNCQNVYFDRLRYVVVDDDGVVVVAVAVAAAAGDGVVLNSGDRGVNAAHSLNSFGRLAKSHLRHSDHDA